MIKLCHLDDINEGESRGFKSGEYNVFAVKKQGEVYLYHNSCPHLGISLEWMPDQFLDVEGSLIQCATHGALFLIESGECIAGPCQGDCLLPCPFSVQQDGQIYIQITT
ncbi:Rieske (2Fe-2S) protein [Spartinivicinus ruber]|uniref:Rieske (2Fe-2S) protein n=1 Tax=Spartinivicinus ruber TaxID=2683272 RepID=UPI0013D0C6A6|nr:Rieske (2Fe-2S) protein [Spartinivicinus ruber]